MFTTVQDVLIDQLIEKGISECEIGTLFQTADEWQEILFRLHLWAGRELFLRLLSIA